MDENVSLFFSHVLATLPSPHTVKLEFEYIVKCSFYSSQKFDTCVKCLFR